MPPIVSRIFLLTRNDALVPTLLIGLWLLRDVTFTFKYVYPQYDYGQDVVVYFICLIFLLFTLGFIIFRLFRLRLFAAAYLLAASYAMVYLLVLAMNPHYWRFKAHEQEYLKQIEASKVAAPKYIVFDWGDIGGGFGNAPTFEALVYDESDEILRDPNSWTPEWLARAAVLKPSWLTHPDHRRYCKRNVESFGSHFYYVGETC